MDDRLLLRHSLAIIAYRGGKQIRTAPPEFWVYDTGDAKTPLHILSHISDLIHWALTLASGQGQGQNRTPGTPKQEIERFHSSLAELDAFLGSSAPIMAEIPRLLAGPIADSLTHIGQLAILRRMSGSPTIGENYYTADIVTGHVGPEQSPPVKPVKR